MSSNHDDEGHIGIAEADLGMTLISDSSMPVESSAEQCAHSDPNTAQEHLPSAFSQDFLSEGDADSGLGDWLTHENFGGLLHSWPFVLDDTDMRPATDITTYRSAKPVADLQESWYTHLGEDQAQSGYVTPILRHDEIDDNYRQSLHRRLQVRSLDQNLPPVEFMNLCVKSYFKRFHHIFPVVHAPTFRPLKTNSVLLLSICSIGSLLTGHPSAYQRGTQLFERLHKAILAHWERLIRRGPEETLAMIQASLIGQTFGLLSGQAKHLSIMDAFHGTVISWARRAKIFQTQHVTLSDHQDLDSKWRAWVHNEEKIRVALGLRIHDAEIASILHHETLLPSASRISQAASDVLFFAPSAQEWFALYSMHGAQSTTPTSKNSPGLAFLENLHHRLMSIPEHSYFTIYAALEDVCSEIIEASINESLTTASIDNIQQYLIQFYEHRLRESQFEPLRNGSKVLWHYLFILLHSDLDLLERSIGRDGSDLSASDLSNVQIWAKSFAAKRCAVHAIMIKRNLECFPLNSEPAIHVPKAIFSSAICLFCYSKHGDGGNDSSADFPEFHVLDTAVHSLLREAKGGSSTDVEMGLLYGLVDLLQRIGHWGISRTFASILGVLLQAESG